MEDSFEIIIYIIATIIAIVASIVRAQSKKKATENGTSPKKEIYFPDIEIEPVYGPYTEDDEDDETEFQSEDKSILQEETHTESQIEFEPVEKVIISEYINKDESPDREFIEGEAIFQSTNDLLLSDEISDNISLSELISSHEMIGENEDIQDEKNEIEWEKAIIYSEILNRKEF